LDPGRGEPSTTSKSAKQIIIGSRGGEIQTVQSNSSMWGGKKKNPTGTEKSKGGLEKLQTAKEKLYLFSTVENKRRGQIRAIVACEGHKILNRGKGKNSTIRHKRRLVGDKNRKKKKKTGGTYDK